MINELIDAIVDRFNDISAINTSGINNLKAIRSKWYLYVYCYDVKICSIYFEDFIYIYIYSLYGVASDDQMKRLSIFYDDFTDVDEFVGIILCKVFYG